MTLTPVQAGNSILRPRARLIKTIGEELISNDVVAIIELVKNSYDANASIIEIRFEGRVIEVTEGKRKKRVLIKENSTLSISDDGSGMTLGVIKGSWMEPATIMKKNQKMSPGDKRRYTGEKGIGRFASAKLATKLKMITRPKDDNETVVDFNWADFSDDNKYLDQVECSWEVRTPLQIKKTGTTLILSNLNVDWDEDKFRELRIALSRLNNPVAPITDFLMDVQLPKELEDFSGIIVAPESLNKPDYYIKGSVDTSGVPDLKFFSRQTGKEEALKVEDSEFKLREPVRKSVLGPFSFEFRVWNRDSDSLKKLASDTNSSLKNVRGDLDDLAGISIYRDNFRVLPYGNKNDDWLRLDIRRVNNPTLRLSNNQIVGYVSVSLDKNPDLTDQSNREGLVESQAFTDLKELIRNILNQVEQKRYAERPRESDETKNKEGVFNRFSITPVVELVQKKLPDDKEANKIVADTEASIKEGVKKIQEVISRYRRLSTLGLLIDVILHDGNNFLARIDTEIHLLKKEVGKDSVDVKSVAESIKNINEERKVLAQLFKRLEPFGGRKRGRPNDIILEEAIENVFGLYENELSKLNIEVLLPSSKNDVRIDEGELQLIFVNLIQNAIYWLETVQGERKIQVEVERTDDELSLVFSDSGPGVKEGNERLIFDPYFSTRPDGVGLGLTIVGELVTEYDGDFSLINNGPLDGASFRITFRRRI
jgi:signal transduction histidine kinase